MWALSIPERPPCDPARQAPEKPRLCPDFSRKVRYLRRFAENFQSTHQDMKGASFGNLETAAGNADIPFIAASTLRLRIE
jgi:hypothetical protein